MVSPFRVSPLYHIVPKNVYGIFAQKIPLSVRGDFLVSYMGSVDLTEV